MEVWCLSAAWQPLPRSDTGRVGCRTRSGATLPPRLAGAQIACRGGEAPSDVRRASAQRPVRRATASSILPDSRTRKSLRVGRLTSTATTERTARCAPNPARKAVTTSSPAAASAGEEAMELVEPRLVDALQPGEQRVDPGGAARGGAPVEEDDLAGGAAQQVVDPDVPVGDVRHRGPGLPAQDARPAVGVGAQPVRHGASRRVPWPGWRGSRPTCRRHGRCRRGRPTRARRAAAAPRTTGRRRSARPGALRCRRSRGGGPRRPR